MANPRMPRVARCFLLAILAMSLWGSCAHDESTIDKRSGLFKDWGEECRIHSPCPNLEPLPICPKDVKPEPPPLPTSQPPGTEATYSLAGRLAFDRGWVTLVGCQREMLHQHCCNDSTREAHLVLANKQRYLLPHVGCFGDESRLCCDIAAKARDVVVTGVMRLEGDEDTSPEERRWVFQDDVTICALALPRALVEPAEDLSGGSRRQ